MKAPIKVKICSRCKKEKDITEFHKDQRSKDKLRYACKECYKKYDKEWRSKNREKMKKYLKKYNKEYRKNNPIKIWCYSTFKNHQRRGYIVRFNFKDLLPIAKQTKYCPICGCKLDWNTYKGKIQDNSPSLDRINNEKFLTLNNTKIICYRCNRAKGQMSMKEFVNYCKIITDKFLRKDK